MFNANEELLEIRKQKKLRIKRSYTRRKSKLDEFCYELVQLETEGASLSEMRLFLQSKSDKFGKVNVSTISRYLKKIKEN